jgi:hypothetical protein
MHCHSVGRKNDGKVFIKIQRQLEGHGRNETGEYD